MYKRYGVEVDHTVDHMEVFHSLMAMDLHSQHLSAQKTITRRLVTRNAALIRHITTANPPMGERAMAILACKALSDEIEQAGGRHNMQLPLPVGAAPPPSARVVGC